MTTFRNRIATAFLFAAIIHAAHSPHLKRLPYFPGIVIEAKEGVPGEWVHADESVDINPMDFGTPTPGDYDYINEIVTERCRLYPG